MAEKKHESPSKPKESYPRFSLSNHYNQLGLGFDSGSGLFPSPAKPLPAPPPPTEVLPSEESRPHNANPEPVIISEELTLLKGRVNTFDVFGVANSDLVPGKYEGGLKLWEGSLDLVRTLWNEIQLGKLSVKEKRVLELGCGHGLPGIFACIYGASAIHFQDFNSEVLKCLTIPNVNVNLESFHKKYTNAKDQKTILSPEIRFFAGDWSEIHDVLFQKCDHDDPRKDSGLNSTRGSYAGYDIILMAETVYELSSLPNLYSLVKKCLSYPHGVVYMSGKKHYFGVGGGTRQFHLLVEEDGVMDACLIAEVADGSSNVRECLSYPHGVVYMSGKKHYFGVGGGTRQFHLLVEEDGVMDACLIAEVADGSSNVRECTLWLQFYTLNAVMASLNLNTVITYKAIIRQSQPLIPFFIKWTCALGHEAFISNGFARYDSRVLRRAIPQVKQQRQGCKGWNAVAEEG
ncbi:hypothetical protein J5N97_003942 [Dioscorea zingiberensis]|uniref:protein-histidine N-methyltransferase n=1 Tax=Dioscorea zingiberensis TaxID=325984 RepID=A0A9D5D5K6_9LILI|nr:hypothetical protein J5N97_003942 [Dioscorea zingiberensis]